MSGEMSPSDPMQPSVPDIMQQYNSAWVVEEAERIVAPSRLELLHMAEQPYDKKENDARLATMRRLEEAGIMDRSYPAPTFATRVSGRHDLPAGFAIRQEVSQSSGNLISKPFLPQTLRFP